MSQQGKSVGERLSSTEGRLSTLEKIVDTLDSRVRYMDAVQRAWIDREGPEAVQKMVTDYTAKRAAQKLTALRAKVAEMLSGNIVASTLEVGSNSIIVVQVHQDGLVPDPQLLRSRQAAPLIGAKVGDKVGKYEILEVYDFRDGVADA